MTVEEDTAAPRPRIATSLLISLSAVTDAPLGSTPVLYAAAPGALIDLAADLSYALGIDLAAFVLDSHLVVSPDSDGNGEGLAGLEKQLIINQAIGVLIARGHTPESARAELHRLADVDHGELYAAAQQIVMQSGTGPGGTA